MAQGLADEDQGAGFAEAVAGLAMDGRRLPCLPDRRFDLAVVELNGRRGGVAFNLVRGRRSLGVSGSSRGAA